MRHNVKYPRSHETLGGGGLFGPYVDSCHSYGSWNNVVQMMNCISLQSTTRTTRTGPETTHALRTKHIVFCALEHSRFQKEQRPYTVLNLNPLSQKSELYSVDITFVSPILSYSFLSYLSTSHNKLFLQTGLISFRIYLFFYSYLTVAF